MIEPRDAREARPAVAWRHYLLVAGVAGVIVLWRLGGTVIEDHECHLAITVRTMADVSAEPDMRFSAGDFYQTISKEMPGLRRLYVQAEKSLYDFYALGRRLIFYAGGGLRALHSGLLLTYVAWCVLGLVVLLWLFVSASK